MALFVFGRQVNVVDPLARANAINRCDLSDPFAISIQSPYGFRSMAEVNREWLDMAGMLDPPRRSVGLGHHLSRPIIESVLGLNTPARP